MFTTRQLQAVAREMASQCGVENTPEEWGRKFNGMIVDYRSWYPYETAELDDAAVWELIRELVMRASDG